MTTGTAGTAARQLPQQLIHFLRKSISYADGASKVYTIGTIPAGSLILKDMSGVHVTTAYNSGTNKLMHIGVSGNTDLFGTSLSVATATFVPCDEAIGGYLVDADTVIQAEMALTGTAASAGAGEVVICYIPDTDG